MQPEGKMANVAKGSGYTFEEVVEE